MTALKWRRWITRYLDAARSHGENGDPDMEVGDLQTLLDVIAPLVPDDKRAGIVEQFADYLQQWERGR